VLYRRAVRRLLLLLGALVLVAGGGCQAFSDGVPRSGCEGVEAAMCSRLVAEMAADRIANVSSIAIRCATGLCDAHDGDTTISIGMADGTSVSRAVSWHATNKTRFFPVVPTCEEIERDACNLQAASSWTVGEEPNIVRIHLRCEPGMCGPDEGTGVRRVAFRDGAIREESWSYALTPEPAPGEP
jgi:hypothetical protein